MICACIPYPGIRVSHQFGRAHHTQDVIEQLTGESASRERVIEALGVPIRYKKEFMSYIACGRQGCIDFYEGWSEWGRDDSAPYNCFEFVIGFDEQDRVNSYRKILIPDIVNYTVSSGIEEERIRDLKECAERGDILAKSLLKKTIVYRLEQGDPAAQFQMYYREPDRISKLKWLCRAADSGYADAQAEVGRIFMWGLLGLQQDYLKAYQWYWYANNQIPDSWNDELRDAYQLAPSIRPLSTLPPNKCKREIFSNLETAH